MDNRRRKFLINKPLQIRYMAYIASALLIVSFITILNLYFSIWGGVLEAFSDEKIQQDLLTASRLTEYEAARVPQEPAPPTVLQFFKEAEKLSSRQREVFKGILDESNRKLAQRLFLLLVLIAWGSVYLSHKIAGPLYRLQKGLEQLDAGDLRTRIHLRKFDEAQFLASRLNETLQNLDRRVAKLKAIASDPTLRPDQLKTRLEEELSQIRTSENL